MDVGSGSVRAGVFDLSGQLLSHATHKITTVRRSGQRVEQSSEQIWQAVCRCIADALDSAGVAPQSVAGIGF
ncbi:Autoinducer 2 kinase LsrK [Leclercia adecarboxylata]|uniref:Autoinducer 2 kinase LsrK n=1 Tax=Leclercia adecarboxylata TaxID=83655 RepID=A0A4U9I5Y4_9ENTR|nr:Autoinducer 2 kinase LsrK [Leclercia adecarboxylata]